MKRLIFLSFIATTIIGLHGCGATTGNNANNVAQGQAMPSSDYLNRQDVPRSPMGAISGASGATHQGMAPRP